MQHRGDVNAEAIEALADLMRNGHVLFADPSDWSACKLPAHESGEEVAEINAGLVKLIMATAEV